MILSQLATYSLSSDRRFTSRFAADGQERMERDLQRWA
jgi:hypothetical protein